MGLEVNASRKYLAIVAGKLQERIDTHTTMDYTHISHVHLVNVSIRKVLKDKANPDSEVIGELLQLHLIDEKQYYVVEMWANGRYATCFYKLMENIDLNKEIGIFPEEKIRVKENGKEVKEASLFVTQKGIWVKWKYLKDNMGDCPSLVEDLISDGAGGTKIVWKNDLQVKYFRDKLYSYLIPALKRKINPFPAHPIFEGIVRPGEIAGNYFGQNVRTQNMKPVSDAESNYGANNLTAPLDDLPF